MKKRVKALAIALLAAGLSLPALATVQASLDHDQLAPGDTVQLTLQRDGSTDAQPDLSPLKNDFDVLGTQTGSSVQFMNGHASEQTQVILTLAPKHGGKITIPPLQWDGDHSPPLTVNVGGNGSAGSVQGSTSAAPAPADSAGDNDIFITSTLDQPQPYAGSTVLLTVRLYTDRSLAQLGLDLPANSAVQAQPQGKSSQQHESRNGHDYLVFEQQYLLSPQKSGKLTLDGPVVDGQVMDNQSGPFGGDPFFGNMLTTARPLHLHGKPIVLDVRPRPADAAGHDLLPAAALVLQESWQPDSSHIKAGEPLTRHLHLSATGLSAAQLPDLTRLLNLPDGLKAYPDQPKTDTSLQGNKVVGTVDQDIAIIASQPGHYELPAVHLNWWDSSQNVQRDATLPARTLEVLPGASGDSSAATTPSNAVPAASSPATTPTLLTASRIPWPWISLALFVLWLLTLMAWWRERRLGRRPLPATSAGPAPAAPPKPAAGAAALKAFQKACQDNNAQAAHQQLLAWADGHWPAQAPWGIHALTERLDANLTPLLLQLDRACYAGGDWQGAALARAMTVPKAETATAKKSALPDLYS